MKGKRFFEQLMKDKDGSYNLREPVTLVFVLITAISWVAEQFFGIHVPEYMFYAFVGIVGAGCFGYSIERRSNSFNNNENQKNI